MIVWSKEGLIEVTPGSSTHRVLAPRSKLRGTFWVGATDCSPASDRVALGLQDRAKRPELWILSADGSQIRRGFREHKRGRIGSVAFARACDATRESSPTERGE